MSVPARTKKSKAFMVSKGAPAVPVDLNSPHTFVSVYPPHSDGTSRHPLAGIAGKLTTECLTTSCAMYQPGVDGRTSLSTIRIG